ncbi:MAG: Elongation factor Ts [Microgenomates group bacterium GW2011_GWF2_47_9]|nr:MAG: Elongation factor Ts [Microgenomates group bacterium GW2011_GWF2_47_9]
MTITAQDVKLLRDETGAGIMDAKRALESADGNIEKAKAIIRAKGMERAEKKADRETGATYVFSYVHFNGKTGSLVKMACETDFVAKTDDFQTLGREVAMQVASMNPESVEALLTQDYLRDSSKTIEELVKEVSGKTGENVRVLTISRL